MGRPSNKQLHRKPEQGTTSRREVQEGPGGGKGKGDTVTGDKTCWLFKQGKCMYGKDCKFKHEAGASKGASVRQLSVEALENSTKVTLPMAGHELEGEGWSIVRPRRLYKNALYRAARVLEAPETSSAVTYTKGCDTFSGCWRT